MPKFVVFKAKKGMLPKKGKGRPALIINAKTSSGAKTQVLRKINQSGLKKTKRKSLRTLRL